MHKDPSLNLPSSRQFPCKILLLAGWCLGLVLGICYVSQADGSFFVLMRRAAESPVSIVGLLAVLVLPFLITAFAVLISRPQLLILLAFLKAFSFGACACCVDQAFLSAGWLLRIFLMFSDLLSLPVLLWLWLRCISGERRRTVRDLVFSGVLLAAVGTVDYCLVSPALALLYR